MFLQFAQFLSVATLDDVRFADHFPFAVDRFYLEVGAMIVGRYLGFKAGFRDTIDTLKLFARAAGKELPLASLRGTIPAHLKQGKN